MKKNLTIFLIFSPLMLFAQMENLYLVMGHPYPHISTQFPGIIFQFRNDSLLEARRFSEPSLLLENVRYYPDLGYLSVVTQEHRKREGKRMLITLFDVDSLSIQGYEVDFGEGFGANCQKEALLKFNEKQIYDCFSCRHSDTRERRFFGINIYTGQTREILPKDFAHALVSGTPGGALEAWDVQLLYSNPNDGQLVIPKTPKIQDRPLYPLVIPNSFQPGKTALVGVHVNNSYFTAVNMNIEDSNKESIGMNHFIVFNKQTQAWHKWEVEGSRTTVRGFDKWIAGNVAALNVILVFDEQDRLKEKIPLSRVSPGKDKRRKKGTDTGTPFDLRAEFFDSYYPGVLFLHDITSGVTIKWSTNQGDSEILLVENNEVYYRVNDEIYKAPILNGKKLGKAELLIKNEMVPDIHWAFISK
jgi:hypothetical protein